MYFWEEGGTWLLSPNKIILLFTHVVMCINSSFLMIAQYHSVWFTNQKMNTSVDSSLATTNWAVINIPLVFVLLYPFISLR